VGGIAGDHRIVGGRDVNWSAAIGQNGGGGWHCAHRAPTVKNRIRPRPEDAHDAAYRMARAVPLVRGDGRADLCAPQLARHLASGGKPVVVDSLEKHRLGTWGKVALSYFTACRHASSSASCRIAAAGIRCDPQDIGLVATYAVGREIEKRSMANVPCG